MARQAVKIGERAIQVVSLGKHKVYAIKMGSGAVETAVSAQALLARFRCDRAYSLGPVGALSDELTIGKWYPGEVVHGLSEGDRGPAPDFN